MSASTHTDHRPAPSSTDAGNDSRWHAPDGLPADVRAALPGATARSRKRVWLLLTAGAVLAIVFIVVLLNIEVEHRPTDRGDVAAAFEGDALPTIGVEHATDIRDMRGDVSYVDTQRGWIQATENGRLSQEYRYARSEPAAGGRLRMLNPEVKIYMDNGRVLTLEGETADVFAPNKALESGTMSGDVVIRLFDLDDEGTLDDDLDTPVLEVRTAEASFDNFQGEIRCPGDVDIQTATAHLPATGLRMQINDVDRRPGQLTIDRISGELRLSEAARDRATPDTAQAVATAESESSEQAESPSPSETLPPARAESPDARERVAASGDSRRADQRARDRARQRREARSSRGQQPAPLETTDGPFFYRLTLNKNVRIRQGDGTTGWSAQGDQLHMIFSLDAGELDTALSLRPLPHREHSRSALVEPMTLEAFISILAVASTSQAVAQATPPEGLFTPSETDTVITCEGPLTMVPLLNKAEQPESADDSRFELIGGPVVLHNEEERTSIRCATLRYASLSEVMELVASPQQMLVIDSPNLYAECRDRFLIDRRNNHGWFQGAGWMLAGEDESATGSPMVVDGPIAEGDVRIVWNERVDLQFDPAESERSDGTTPEPGAHDSFGRLKTADFAGSVAVASTDFTLDSDRMSVGFPGKVNDEAADKQLASLEYIHAQSHVRARGINEQGSISCDDLSVRFARVDGRTIPQHMTATGQVAAVDQDQQTVWADQLDVFFRSAIASSTTSTTPEAQQASRRAEVETFDAAGSVQIQMADGARVFADHLHSDGEGQQIVLTGDNVVVVSDRTIIEKGTRLELSNRGDLVKWIGPGEFAYHASAILPEPPNSRIVRPQIDETVNARQMKASWAQSLVYDATYNDGAGSIVLSGHVDARSTPSELESNSLIAGELTLLFTMESIPDTQPQPAQTMPEDQPSLFDLEQTGRRLKTLIAKADDTGDARLESRSWLNADHSDTPRVFALSGPIVEYDDQTLEAHVHGDGTLLVRDERPEAPSSGESAPAQPGQADLPFGARGTTLFSWTDSLHMTRTAADTPTYDIALHGGVEVRHRALNNDLSTMTGNVLLATVDRTQGMTDRDAGFDLGGSMDLKRIRAQGHVYVDAPTRDVDCDEFVYDYGTGVAQLIAQPGRSVTIMTANNPHPVRAESFEWNTITDTVVVKRASGSGGR